MIAAMKKITLLFEASRQESVLQQLRKLGILHIKKPASSNLLNLKESKTNIEKLERVLASFPPDKGNELGSNQSPTSDGLQIANNLIEWRGEVKLLKKEISQAQQYLENEKLWQSFDAKKASSLEISGLFLHYYRCKAKDLKQIPTTLFWRVIAQDQKNVILMTMGKGEEIILPFNAVEPPKISFNEKVHQIEINQARLANLEGFIKDALLQRDSICHALQLHQKRHQFALALASMEKTKELALLQGYCPSYQVETILKASRLESWGLLVEEPGSKDLVPVKLIQSKIAALFQPIIRFIGVVPGYREVDVNLPFLIFFTIFFALLIGDAGYGVVLLILTMGFHKRVSSVQKGTIQLAYLLTIATILIAIAALIESI